MTHKGAMSRLHVAQFSLFYHKWLFVNCKTARINTKQGLNALQCMALSFLNYLRSITDRYIPSALQKQLTKNCYWRRNIMKYWNLKSQKRDCTYSLPLIWLMSMKLFFHVRKTWRTIKMILYGYSLESCSFKHGRHTWKIKRQNFVLWHPLFTGFDLWLHFQVELIFSGTYIG